MAKHRSNDVSYVDWLTGTALTEGPLDDIAHAAKRGAKRAGLAAKSFAGSKSADGEFDVMDVTAKLRNHYLRDTKAIGAAYSMRTLAEFLLNNYGVVIDPSTGKVQNDNPREGMPSGGKNAGQSNTNANGAPHNDTPTPNPEPVASKAEPEAEAEAQQAAPETPQEPAPARKPIRYNMDSPDGQQALQQVAMLLRSPSPNGLTAMRAVQRLLAAAKRDRNPDEKQFVAKFLKTMRDDPAIQRKVPQLADLDDAALQKFMENWVRLVDCTVYLVEAEIRDPKEVKNVVNQFFAEAFDPNAKIDRATVDQVLTGVAKFLNAAGAVKFKGKENGPDIGFLNRGNSDDHVQGRAGNLDSVAAARTGATNTGATARPAGSSSRPAPAQSDTDRDGKADSHDDNVSARLNPHMFETTLEELGMTDEEIKDVWDKAYSYRNNPKALYDTMRDGKSIDWAKRIAVAAMVSILVDIR